MIGIDGRTKGDDDSQLSAGDLDAQRWVAALTLTGLLMTLLVIAGLYVATTPRHVDLACVHAKMSDGHALMEASFQTSPEQDVIAKSKRACAR